MSDRFLPTSPRVLVVDDEQGVRDALERALKLERFDVVLADGGQAALDALSDGIYDAIVLDVSMPRIDGLEVCARLRSIGDRTPVLMLTARDAIDDRVAGLDAGADDYLVKPFALRELKARLRALMRRSEVAPGSPVLVVEDLRLNRVSFEVHRGERRLQLTKTEFLLLQFFMEHPNRVLGRSELFEAVWGYDFGGTSNSLGVYVGLLRRKTEEGGEHRLLHTVRSIGYVLRRQL